MTAPRLDDAELRRQWAAYQASKKAAPAPAPDPYKPTTPRAAAESSSAASVKPTGEVYWNDPVGLGRQALQGASFGLADEAEAAVRAPFSDQPYAAIRDDIRGQNKAYSDANPGTAMLANVAGGLATGGAVKAGGKALLSRLAPSVAAKLSSAALPGTSLLTTKGRAINAAAEGALMGGAAGAGSAEGGLKERVQGAAVGAAMGGALAGGFSAIADGTRGLAKLSRAAIAGPEARALPSVQEGAQTRLLSNLARNNKSVDDLAAWSATADAPDILGEGMGTPGLRQLGTAYRYGNTPDEIEQGLTRRARDEVGRVQSAVRREIGDPIDDEAFKAAKLLEARTAAKPIYDEAVDGVTITDPRVGDLLERPAAATAYDATVKGYANRGQALPSRERLVGEMKSTADDGIQVFHGSADKIDRFERRFLGDNTGAGDAEIGFHFAGDRNDANFYAEMAARKRGSSNGVVGEYRLRPKNPLVVDGDLADEFGGDKNAAYAYARKNGHDAIIYPYGTDVDSGYTAIALTGDIVHAPASAPSLPSLPAKAVQRWKLELDDEITRLEGKEGGATSQKMAELVQVRDEVESLLYEHANVGEDGAGLWGKAQQTYAKPMQERDAFAMGQAKGRAMQPADQERLLSDPNAEYVAKGVGNTIQEDLGRLQSGAAGQIRNPAPTVMGSDYADARLNVAARGDKGKVERIQSTASNAQRRLQNRYDVLKGSQTAERMASDAMELGTDVQKMAQAARSPLAAALNMLGKATEGARRRATGAELDLAAELLMAGAPGAMTRQKAIETLRAAAPSLVAKQAGRVAVRGRVAGAVAGSAGR